MEIYGNGSQFRDYIHVKDCSRAIDLILSKGDTDTVYNVGNGKTWCLLDIIQYVAVFVGSNSEITFIEPKDFHKKVQTPSFYMNIDKLKKLGYEPEYTGEKLYHEIAHSWRRRVHGLGISPHAD